MTGAMVRYEPYQKSLKDFPQLSEAQCRLAVQLIMPEGIIYSGAHAVFRALTLTRRHGSLLWLYEHVPFFRIAAERIYQFIAHRRSWLSKMLGVQQCKR